MVGLAILPTGERQLQAQRSICKAPDWLGRDEGREWTTQGALSTEEAGRRAGVRNHQVGARIPRILGATSGESENGIEPGRFGVQLQAFAPVASGASGPGSCGAPTANGRIVAARNQGAGIDFEGAESPFRAAPQSDAFIADGAVSVSHPSLERNAVP